MSDEEMIGLMVRLPRSLHEEVKRFSQGNGKRPKASLNATITFLLRAGLDAQKSERKDAESGKWAPALIAA